MRLFGNTSPIARALKRFQLSRVNIRLCPRKQNSNMNEKIDLRPGQLARPMDKSAMGNDLATLRALVGELNNPNITGAVVEDQPDLSIKADAEASPAKPDPAVAQAAFAEARILQATQTTAGLTESKPLTLAPAPVLTPEPVEPFGTRKVFFTGQPKSGKSYLAASIGARTIEIDDPIRAMITDTFPDARAESIAPLSAQIFAWGEGVVSAKVPLTAERLQFVHWFREISNAAGTFGVELRDFGTAGFWVRSLISRVNRFCLDFPAETVVVTGVYDNAQYKALLAAGFTHFHVVCNNITRTGRGGSAVTNPLADAIERDLTKKLSGAPRGPKFKCIWADTNYPPPSNRLLTIDEFVKGVAQ